MAEISNVPHHQEGITERMLSEEKSGRTNKNKCGDDVQPLQQTGHFCQTAGPVEGCGDRFRDIRQNHVSAMQ